MNKRDINRMLSLVKKRMKTAHKSGIRIEEVYDHAELPRINAVEPRKMIMTGGTLTLTIPFWIKLKKEKKDKAPWRNGGTAKPITRESFRKGIRDEMKRIRKSGKKKGNRI